MKNIFFLILFSVFGTSTTAQINNSLHFAGNTNYVSLQTPILPTASASDPWTFEAWIKLTDISGHKMIMSQYLLADYRLTFRAHEGILSASKKAVFGTVTTSVSSPDPIVQDTWYHVAVVKEGSGANQFHIYVDGVLKGSSIDDLPNGSYITELGRINAGNTSTWAGNIDEARFWSDARTAQEINDHMNTELSGNEANLLAYYNFNQGTPGGNNTGITSLTDSSPNGNDGLINNFLLNGNSSNFVDGTPAILLIPTMGEWALIIFALIMLSISTVYVMRWNKTLNKTAQLALI